jgi:hypothetical protein
MAEIAEQRRGEQDADCIGAVEGSPSPSSLVA